MQDDRAEGGWSGKGIASRGRMSEGREAKWLGQGSKPFG